MLKDRNFYGKNPRGAPNARLVGEGGRGGVEMVGEEWEVTGGRWRCGPWGGGRQKRVAVDRPLGGAAETRRCRYRK